MTASALAEAQATYQAKQVEIAEYREQARSKDPAERNLARLRAEIAEEDLADLSSVLAAAQAAHDAARDAEVLDAVIPTLAPLDQATHDNLRAVESALAALVAGARRRDAVAAAKSVETAQIRSSRRAGGVNWPSVDGYSLTASSSSAVHGELCRLLEPIFRGLHQGGFADLAAGEARSANRLPPVPEIP